MMRIFYVTVVLLLAGCLPGSGVLTVADTDIKMPRGGSSEGADTDTALETGTENVSDTSSVSDTYEQVDTGLLGGTGAIDSVVDTAAVVETGLPAETGIPIDTADTHTVVPDDTGYPVIDTEEPIETGDTGIPHSTEDTADTADSGETGFVDTGAVDTDIEDTSVNDTSMLIDTALVDTGETGVTCDDEDADCIPDDVDKLIVMPGGSTVCMPADVLPVDYQSFDAYWVGADPLIGNGFSELCEEMRVSSADGRYCIDFATVAGCGSPDTGMAISLPANTYWFELVSSQSNVSYGIAANPTDSGDWVYADMQSYCAAHADPYCYAYGVYPYNWQVKIYWNGVEIMVP